jgi:choline dehydrogenase
MMRRADVVIVGAGSAGAVLAGRLSEDPGRSVLVLEAGPVYTAGTLPESIRQLSRRLQPEHDWAHEADSAGRRIPYTRGKVAGGSSSINATMAFRPVPGDVDGWGIDGWSWADLLPHFVAIEHDLDVKAPFHGTDGPLPLVRFGADELTPMQLWFVQRALALGMRYEADHNDPSTVGGVGPIPMNRNGRDRVSAADAWLYPALDRPNLTVLGDTLVDRVLVEGGRAVGVEVAGERIEAGEVVLSGGVLQSPSLLRRSGIDLPGIGANLSDHPSVPIPVRLDAEPDKHAPTIQVMSRLPSPVTGRPFDLQLFPTTYGVLWASPQSVDARGRVGGDGHEIRIDWPFVDDPRCAAELRAGVRLAVELADGRAELDLDVTDDDAVDAYVRAEHRAFLHGCGTCALGDVVDEELRVRGVDALRVCDTSVLPEVPRANPNLTILAVADRAATLMSNG